ncbi:hypothetical protein V5O48_003383 [Marasmius crinis-equi]|uniref:Uncharacterized protein n=1 Tax=Marasmius crinis-equi TaxID=585013 RepID=A0ABR3FTE0_9AGAR
MSPSKRPQFLKPHNFTRVQDSNRWTCNLCPGPSQMNPHQALIHESSPQHAEKAAMNEPHWWGPMECNWESDEAWAQPIVDDPPLSKEAMKDREHRYFADQVDDLVPFWIRSVEAAEHGEVLKLSDFLESLEDRDIWPPRVPNPWRNPEAQSVIGGKGGSRNGWTPDWDMALGWKSHSEVSWGSNEQNGISQKGAGGEWRHDHRKSKLGYSHPQERVGHDFVEDIATQEAADDVRRHEMHVFFEVRTAFIPLQAFIDPFIFHFVKQLPTTEKVKRIHDLIRSLHDSQGFPVRA